MDTNLERLSHNFLFSLTGGSYQPSDAEFCVKFSNFIQNQKELPKYKVALLFICMNPNYWEYAKNVFETSKKFFLPGHQVDKFIWSDIPKPDDSEAFKKAEETLRTLNFQRLNKPSITPEEQKTIEDNVKSSLEAGKQSSKVVYESAKVFPIDPLPWPAGTLYRYHLFLQQESLLKDYDYIFYCDIDMLFVNFVGDEVLDTLVAAQHPMYAFKKQLNPPYEPNKESTAYIPRPGRAILDNGQKRFMPLYFAGGFQGGKSKEFIEAWKTIKKNVDEDEIKLNYHAIWNDETHWNRYLFDYLNADRPLLTLSPSFIYPDSLIKEYYEPIWGCSYPPKIVTLTKKLTLKTLSASEQSDLGKMKDLGKI